VAYRRGVAAGTEPKEQAGAASGPGPGGSVRHLRDVVWRLTRETAAVCFRYRVTGLAAEAGFFALLSLPPLVLGLVGSIGYLGNWIGDTSVQQLENRIIDVSAKVLTADQVREVIKPTLRQVFEGGRFDIISIGFVLALWSGSRALNVFIDTISIMYGLGGRRGIVRTRALSFTLYVGVVVVGSIVIPLVLVGPSLLGKLLPDQVGFLNSLYWPVASLLSVLSLTTLYNISVPVRTPWRRDLPGALLTLVIWFFGSYVVRTIISISVGGTSIYGPLTAPIVLLIWLYVLAIAVLIGAALNAAVETIWPRREMLAARSERIIATPDFKPVPGMETGQVQLPPNRTPPVRPTTGRRRPGKPLARTDEPR
jgi:membrane protein